MTKARAYIRLSRWREGDEKLGPDVQLEMARRLCRERGWELDEEVSVAHQDLDVSGYSTTWKNRPGLQAHFKDAGKYDVLVIAAIDRLGRNTQDTLTAWSEFEKAGVTVYAVREGLDTSTASGALMRNILASVAEMESANSSARIKANVEARARRGRLHGGRLPAWLTKDNGQIVPIPHVVNAILMAVAMRLDGESYVSITRALNAAGHRTAQGKKYQKSWVVKLFTWDWVDSMYGTAYTRRRGRFATDPKTKRRVSRGEPIAIPDAYPKIIDEPTYQKLLTIATAKGEPQTRDRISERWMLNGVLSCAICGSRMGVHSRANPSRRTYFCEAHNDDPTATPHSLGRVDAGCLEVAVLAGLEQILTVINREQTPIPKPILRSVQDVRKEIDRVTGLYVKGTIPEDILDQRLAALNDELTAISKILADDTPITRPNLTKVHIRQWLKTHGVRVEYPVYLDGENYAPNYRTGIPTPIPFVRMTFKLVTILSPVFRMGARGKRQVFELYTQPETQVFYPNPKPELLSKPKPFTVTITDEMNELAKGKDQ